MIIRVGIRVASNIMYIRVMFEAENVSEIRVCRSVMVIRKARCRCSGSDDIICWLAIIVNGRSQYDSVSSGAEIGSRFRYILAIGLR